jgi:selenide,water dikinase
MGGVPKTAMNLVAFPLKDMDISVLRQIIQGGLDKMREAGVVLVGGHSVEDKELKYGLSVTGFIRPHRILTKKNLRVGDRLILTKPLGTGIINTAIKGGLAPKEITDTVTRLMAALNKDAAEIMANYPVHACTDITGFGFLGHLAEMVVDSGAGIRIQANRVPILPQTLNYAGMGLVPAGAYKNREFFERHVDFAIGVDILIQDILFDPQTSGGLLICVEGDRADDLLLALKQKSIQDVAIVGQVVPEPKERIIVE